MTNRLIRLGLQLPTFEYRGVEDANLFERISDIAQSAEQHGFDSLWVMDHFYQLTMISDPSDNMFEAYSLLSALAARTSTIRLGCMVGGMTYRNPAVLAKTVTSLDIISSGRAIWGIGAGWYEQEHVDYGIEFGTFTDRFEKLEEGLQIVKSMFVNDTTTLHGKWFHVDNAMNFPKPIQAGGPPVLIGGGGEKKTLRMVAQYADACNVFGGPAQVRRSMQVLDEHCERLGRDPGSICRTRLGGFVVGDTVEAARRKLESRLGVVIADLPEEQRNRVQQSYVIGDPDTVGEAVQQLLDAGLDGLVVNMPIDGDADEVAFTGDVLARALR